MAVSNVTIRAVQALKPGETIWDADHREAVRGFGVRRQRDQATYVLKYRVFGRQRFVTIGAHGAPCASDRADRYDGPLRRVPEEKRHHTPRSWRYLPPVAVQQAPPEVLMITGGESVPGSGESPESQGPLGMWPTKQDSFS